MRNELRASLAMSSAVAVAGCCTTLCENPSVAHEFELAPPGVATITTAGGECSGAIIEAEAVEDGRWRHRVLTAKHCFPRWNGKLPFAHVRAPIDGGFYVITAQLELWGEGSVEGWPLSLPATHEESEWSPNEDWAIVQFTIAQRLQTIPLARTANLQRGDRVTLLSYLDSEHSQKLVPHEHVFSWGSVPVDVPQHGHSGAPIVANGEIAAIVVQSIPQSLGCRMFTRCRYRAVRYVSADSIRASAHRQGFLLAGEYNPPLR